MEDKCPWIALEVRSDNLQVKCHCQIPLLIMSNGKLGHLGRHHWPEGSHGPWFREKNFTKLDLFGDPIQPIVSSEKE